MFRWSDNCISNRSDRAADVSVVVSGWSKFFRLCCLCLFKTVCRIHVFKTAVATLWFYPHLLFRYTFYDGPPFATGLPHYGHILAGTIKDIVTRFAHQSGFHVDRRFGWDCHGLPVVRDPRLRRRPRETFRPPRVTHALAWLFRRSTRSIRLWGSKDRMMWPRWASPSTTSSAEASSWDTPKSGRWESFKRPLFWVRTGNFVY